MTLLRCGHPGCNYSSARKNNLARHQRTHSGEPTPPAIGRNGWVSADSELAGAGAKPYRCDEPGCTYATADEDADVSTSNSTVRQYYDCRRECH